MFDLLSFLITIYKYKYKGVIYYGNKKKQIIGMFFEIDGKKYVTEINYRSKDEFQKLIEGFSKNVKLDHLNNSDNFILVDYLLNDVCVINAIPNLLLLTLFNIPII